MIWLDQKFAENIAVIQEDGEPLTYRALTTRVEEAARIFQPRTLVFCLVDNTLASLTAYLGALAARAVPLLLNANLGEAPFAALIAAYAPAYLFLREGATFPGGSGRVVGRIGDRVLIHRDAGIDSVPHDDLALLLATSGSTGSPKLVRLSEKNLRANARSIASYLGIDEREKAITSLPMSYSYGLSVINSHLLCGASVVLTDRSLVDPRFWPLVRDQSVTSMAGVPYSYEMLLKLRLERLVMPTVTTLTQAGGRLAPEKVAAVAAACRNKGVRFFPMYGQTEATARIAYLPCDWVEKKPASIGCAIPGGRLWLENDAGVHIKIPGEVGELIYAGENVSLGYAENAQDLARGDDNHGVLRTGDLAICDVDGHYTLVGRKQRFIKVFGVRISLDDVERLLAQKGIDAAATGSDDHLLVVRVAAEAIATDDALLIDQLAAWLDIHRSAIVCRRVVALPRVENGKIDYSALQALA